MAEVEGVAEAAAAREVGEVGANERVVAAERERRKERREVMRLIRSAN